MSESKEKPYWSISAKIGAGPGVVHAWERLERSGRVFVKYSVTGKTGRDRRVKHKLDGDITVRDLKGRLDARMVRRASDAVHALAARLQLGQPTRAALAPDDSDLTLRDGFLALLDHQTGKFSTPTRRWDEVRRAQGKLEKFLGPGRSWTTIVPADARRVWRSLAEEAKKSGAGGARQTEVTVDAMYSTANWLRDEERIPMTAAIAPKRWRVRLYEDWEQIVGRVDEPDRPRHEADEMVLLFAKAHDPRVDPRFGLAFDLGGEQRLGQVLRCWRSDLDLTLVALDAILGGAPGTLGMLRVKGRGKKKASPILLTASQRAATDAALSGYLSHFENAFRAGEVADYPLFPAGRFKEGKAKLVATPKSLSRDGARKMFKELEGIAGITHVPGRSWYGVRRTATDLAEDIMKDERVLNSITGHRDSATRRTYQDHERREILVRAAETREKVRRGGGQDSVQAAKAGAGKSA